MDNNWYEPNNGTQGKSEYSTYESYTGQYESGAKNKKRFGFGTLIVCILVVGLLSGCLSAGALWLYQSKKDGEKAAAAQQPAESVVVDTPTPEAMDAAQQPTQEAPQQPAVTPDGTASAGLMVTPSTEKQSNDTINMIQGCMASAVGITTRVSQGNYYVYGAGQGEANANGEVDYGAGSGIILTADGYIVTCAHVVTGGEKIYVCMQDGTEYPAQLIGKDDQTDIAVLKIDETDLPAATLGASSSAVVGETVYAVGNPLGEFVCSVSTGIVSGLNRTLDMDDLSLTLIQTDAAVNPGNSGGGLFNSRGELIGIVNAKTSSVSVEGLGFAIPVDSVKGIITDLMDRGYVSGRPYLGVTLQDVYTRKKSDTPNDPFAGLEGYFGIGYTSHTQIVTIEKGGAADKAGLQVNDIITKLDEKDVSSASSLTSILYEYKAGDTVTITVLRGTEEKAVSVTLGERAS